MAPSNPVTTIDYQAELERLRGEVQALRDQLKHSQRLASMGTLAAMVAHEFNNILTPVINCAQMAQKNPAMMAKAIARAASGGLRASVICQALLGFAGEQPPEPQPVKLGDLVSDTLAAMARDPRKDQIDLVLTVPEDLVLLTRRVELQQVLLNLMLNARAAVLAREGARRIEISARGFDDAVVIAVSDTGIGIKTEDLERVFQPFFTTKAGGNGGCEGNGLGLTVCREIVQEMGGQISVQSAPGAGATFTVYLPRQGAGC